MKVTDVLQLLEKNRDERGINHWNKLKINGWESFGIGLTKLRSLAKQVGEGS